MHPSFLNPNLLMRACNIVACAALILVSNLLLSGCDTKKKAAEIPPVPTIELPDNEELAIDPKELKYMQDAEHLGGFVLGDLAFPKMKNALKAGNVEQFKEFFSDDFQGGIIDGNAGKFFETNFGQIRKVGYQESTAIPADRDRFAEEMVSIRNRYERIDQIGVKIMKMAPVEHGNLAGKWRGTMKYIFAGKEKSGKISYRIIVCETTVSGISEETPDLRKWMTSCHPVSEKYGEANDFLFKDMTAQTGLSEVPLYDTWIAKPKDFIPFLTGGMFFSDFNRDGRLDLLVTDLSGTRLFAGADGAKFEDVTKRVGLPTEHKTVGALWCDFDNDRYEDLIVSGKLYRNVNGLRFEEVSAGRHTFYFPDGAANFSVVDYDRDGKLDIYIVGLKRQTLKPSVWIGKNDNFYAQLWRNLGDWKFEDVTKKAGVVGGGSSTFATVWFDADGNDWPDFMTACEFGENDYYLNQGDGTFKKGKSPGGSGGLSMGITVNDIDNDGFGDPFIANMYSKAGERIFDNLRPGLYPKELEEKMKDFVSGNDLYRNLGNGEFERIGVKTGINDVGWAYGSGYADMDCDGWPDIYSPVGFQSTDPDKPDG